MYSTLTASVFFTTHTSGVISVNDYWPLAIVFGAILPLMMSFSWPRFLQRRAQPEFVRYTEGRLGVAFVQQNTMQNTDMQLKLEVHVPGYYPYQVITALPFSTEALSRLQPGAMVGVLANSSNINLVKVMI